LSRTNIIKKSSLLVVFTMISRVLGLVREIVKAAFLGTSALADAFTIAFLIPNLLRRLFAEGTISAAFIPTFKGYLQDNSKDDIKLFLSSAFTFAVTIFSITVIAGMFAAGPLVEIFGPGFDTKTADEAVFLTKVMFPYLAFISVAAFIQGILNSLGIFGPSGFTPILFNLCFIASGFVLSPFMDNPARAIAVGVTVGGTVQAGFQIPYLLKTGLRFSFTNLKKAFYHPGVRKVLKLIAPTTLGLGAYQLNIIITTRIANGAGEGVVSSLQFSNRLLELILGIFVVSISTVILPELSANVKEGKWDTFNKNLIFGIKIIALISIPATVFTLLFRHEIVSLLFKFGKFDEHSVNLTAYALMFHIAGLFFIAVNRILYPAFFAQEDTVSPTIAGVISLVVNVGLALILVAFMQGGGVALAATIGSISSTVTLLIFLKKGGKIDLVKIFKAFVYSARFFIIVLASSVPLFLIKKELYVFFGNMSAFSGNWNRIVTEFVPFMICVLIFIFIILAILIMSKDENAQFVINKFLRRKSNGKS